MKSSCIRFLAGMLCVLSLLLTACQWNSPTPTVTAPTTEEITESTTLQTEEASVPETTEETLPEPVEYILSFAGDCTLGTSHDTYGKSGTFVRIVGDNYGYPFENVLTYFENDDFTMVNLEGTFTEHTKPAEKRFRFRAPSAYAKILTAGDVEAVNLANNHSLDFGEIGYDDTKKALESENITYVEDCGTAFYTTETGLKIGLYAAQFDLQVSTMKKGIAALREGGAELVIVSFHWGTEGSYRPTDQQKKHAHAAIDAGADIVYGHHPHVLQPIEEYKDGIIYYSLGNFSFGGNRNPKDKDSVVIRQRVIRESDGTVHLGQTELIPFCVSSVSGKNDYKPTPYEAGSKKYNRVLSKLDGTFTGRDLVVSYADKKEPEETTETTAPEETIP